MSNETKPGQIFALMAKVMSEVSEIGKNSRNDAQRYTFRGIDDVMGAFHAPLARNGLFFVPEVLGSEATERQSQKGGTLIYTTVDMAFTFYAPDGSSVTARTRGEAMDSGDKSTNKAMSAALKYALLQTFCVPVEASDDPDANTYEVTRIERMTPKPVASRNPTPDAQPDKPVALSPVDRKALTEEITGYYKGIGWGEDNLKKMEVRLGTKSNAELIEIAADTRAKQTEARATA